MTTTVKPVSLLPIRLLEWIGAIAGIAGAMLIASNTPGSAYGWIAFSASSLALTVFALHLRAWGLLCLQLCFCVTNAVGMWRWLIQPTYFAAVGS